MANQRVVIEVSPSRLEVAVLKGQGVAMRKSQRIRLGSYTENWPDVLDAVQVQLSSLVESVGARGAQATILYASPTASTAVFSCAESAGAVQALKAARLALGESAGFSLNANPHDLHRLTTDSSADGSQPRQVHTLGIADTERTTAAVAEWASLAGVEPVGLVPADVAGTVAAVDRALAVAEPGKVALVLYIGEQASALAAATAGRLRFIRHIGIGAESLVDAMARDVRSAGAKPVTLDTAAAAEILYTYGIPERSRIVDMERGITGDALLPLLQPILQRYVVDIKQSLRFGLEEKERETAALHGIGPGCRVARLLAIVSELAGLSLAANPGHQAEIDGGGNIDAWVGGPGTSVNLLPKALRARITGRRLRRRMWAGVAAAATLVITDAALTRADLSSQRHNLDRLRQRQEAARVATTVQAKLVAAQTALAAARQRRGAQMDNTERWDSILVMLSRSTPAAIRLTQVQLDIDNSQPRCRLVGHAPFQSATASIKAYMDALTAAPVVRTCRLGATQRGEGARGPVQNFEITLDLVGLPSETPALGVVFTAAHDPTEDAQ